MPQPPSLTDGMPQPPSLTDGALREPTNMSVSAPDAPHVKVDFERVVLGDMIAQVQAEYARIRKDEESLCRQRSQWMQVVDDCITSQELLFKHLSSVPQASFLDTTGNVASAKDSVSGEELCAGMVANIEAPLELPFEGCASPDYALEGAPMTGCASMVCSDGLVQGAVPRKSMNLRQDDPLHHDKKGGLHLFQQQANQVKASGSMEMEEEFGDEYADALELISKRPLKSSMKMGRIFKTKRNRLYLLLLFKDTALFKLLFKYGYMREFVESALFDTVVCIVIAASSVFNGWEVELLATDKEKADTMPFREFQFLFTVFFIVEIILRLNAFRCLFFINYDWHWNMFDLSLVFLSCVEAYFWILNSDASKSSSTRVLRSIRIVRNLRVIRMFKFFYGLRQMLRAILGSLKMLVWLGFLLLMLLYFFALTFVSGVTAYLEELPPNSCGSGFGGLGCQSLACERLRLLKKEYGSIARAILSLFKAVTNGESWGHTMEPLQDISALLIVIYIVYISFVVLAFMNAVTGTFVENNRNATHVEKDFLVAQELKEKDRMLTALEQLFEESDHDGSGCLSSDEFTNVLHDEKALAYLKILGIDTDNFDGLFGLIDLDDSGSIDIYEFVKALPRLMGPSASIDVAHLTSDVKKIGRQLNNFMDESRRHFQELRKN